MYRLFTKLSILLTIVVVVAVNNERAFATELRPVAYQNHPFVIAQHYIVTFDDNMSLLKGVDNITADGGRVIDTYESINGFSVNLSDDALTTLRANPNVISIEADRVVHETMLADSHRLENPLNWGLDRIDGTMDEQYVYANSGAGVNVYVLDSGINMDHEQFAEGQVVAAYDAIEDGETACHDHGTGVGSIIGGNSIGVAPAATLHSVRILDCNMSGRVSSIIRAMDWLVNNAQAPAVANMSIGTPNSSAYQLSVLRLISNGVTVVAAAGNVYNYDACNMSPGGEEGVITVSASDENDAVAYFSAMGSCVDLFAPGVDIMMAGNEATDHYWTEDGTSFAAPHVAGCAARYLELNPTATPDEVRSALVGAAADTIIGALGDTTTMRLQCNFGEDEEEKDTPPVDDTVGVGVEADQPSAAVEEQSVPLAITLDSVNVLERHNHLIVLSTLSSLVLLTMVQLKARDEYPVPDRSKPTASGLQLPQNEYVGQRPTRFNGF